MSFHNTEDERLYFKACAIKGIIKQGGDGFAFNCRLLWRLVRYWNHLPIRQIDILNKGQENRLYKYQVRSVAFFCEDARRN